MNKRALRHTVAFTILASAAPALSMAHAAPQEQEAVKYMGRAFVFQADYDYARAAGWVPADATDDDIQERLRAALKTRLRRTGRFVEASVLAEPDGRLAIVFVGRQDARIEAFLSSGLSSAGRLSYRVIATDVDLGQGASLADERARLAGWVESHPGEDLAYFTSQPRVDGGPHPSLEWRFASGTDDLERARPLLKKAVHAVTRSDAPIGRFFAVDATQSGGKEMSLRYELDEAAAGALTDFGASHADRQCVAVIDGRIVDEREDSASLFVAPFVVHARWGSDEARANLMAFAGGPLDAPLSFVEFSQRELMNVKRR